MSRPKIALALAFAFAGLGGCASLLGLDEVTEKAGDAGPADSFSGGGSDGGADSSGGDAGSDAQPGDAGDASPAFDAGCGRVIGTDFNSPALSSELTVTVDGTGTVTFENSGVGGTRAMHATIPTTTGLVAGIDVDVHTLVADGAKSCGVICGADLKLLQRGGPSALTHIVTMQGAGAGNDAHISHSNTFSYFSKGTGPDAPDLGPISSLVFTHVEIQMVGAPPSVVGTGMVGTVGNTKTLPFLPSKARIGLERINGDPAVEAIIDNLFCRSTPIPM
jgi:hypothetical protein